MNICFGSAVPVLIFHEYYHFVQVHLHCVTGSGNHNNYLNYLYFLFLLVYGDAQVYTGLAMFLVS